MFLNKNSLRTAINEEITRNNSTIDQVGKYHIAIITCIFAAIGLIGIQELPKYFSQWILCSNTLVIILMIFHFSYPVYLKKKFPSTSKKGIGDQNSNIRSIIRFYLFIDSAIYIIESIACSLILIFSINLIIILLFIGNLVNGNYEILEDFINITIPLINFRFSIPSTLWFFVQALSFFIIAILFTMKSKLIRSSARNSLNFIPNYSLPIDFNKFQIPFWSGLIFLGSVPVFALTVLITQIKFLDKTISILILIILGIQVILFLLLNTIFCEKIIKRECDNKNYKLKIALGLIEDEDIFRKNDGKKEAEEIYHMARILAPIKRRGLILRSNYMLIPNIVYWDEKYQNLLLKYLKSVF